MNRHWLLFPVLLCALSVSAADRLPPDLLARTRTQVATFFKVFSGVRCTEEVVQATLAKNGKVEHQERSLYDYLVVADEEGPALRLQESRLERQVPQHDAKIQLMVTNGFATLLLIFHPALQNNFEFSTPELQNVNGATLARIAFRHLRSKPTTMELFLRDREYPLDFVGNAWVEPASGSVVRIETDLSHSMDDIGMRVLHTDVQYAPVHLRDVNQSLLLPSTATVELQIRRQHWRNVHRFSTYQHFSVNTKWTMIPQ